MQTLLVLLAALLVNGAFVALGQRIVCPATCACNSTTETVTCSNVDNTTWSAFFNFIPDGARSVFINKAVFPTLSLTPLVQHKTLGKLLYLRILNSNVSFVGEKAFAFFPNLVELHLHRCAIGYLDIDALASLPHLELLNMSNNLITTLHKDAFHSVNKLRILDLANNKLDQLPHTIFHPTPDLQVVNMTENQLSYLHPDTFSNLTQIHTIVLKHNRLETLHGDTFKNLSSLQNVHLSHNPWDCNCGLFWLHNTTNTSHPYIQSREDIRCHTPPEYQSHSLGAVPPRGLDCTPPEILNTFTNHTVFRLSSNVLKCNATGYPPPSVYWLTPRGVLALAKHRKWMTPDITNFKGSHTFIGMPTFHKSKLVALEDGSLSIHQIRSYFSGEYTCVAENPAGTVMMSFNIGIKGVLHDNKLFSMFIGGCCAFSFLILSVIFALIRLCLFHVLKKKHMKEQNMIFAESEESCHSSLPSIYLSRKSPSSFYTSPYDSPLKCTTPAERFDGEDPGMTDARVNIRETLEDVRFRLRTGMERSVGKIRSHAHQVTESSRHYMHTIRESSSYYMQTIKESGSQTIHSLRSSGSQYATRVRAGVVLGVEQVKYHVQSMRELCLSGNIGQTISTISVATDVDSQVRTDVVKKVTYVWDFPGIFENEKMTCSGFLVYHSATCWFYIKQIGGDRAWKFYLQGPIILM